METVFLTAVAAVLVVLAAAKLVQWLRPMRRPGTVRRPWPDRAPRGGRVTLDLVVEDPELPSVRRLVDNAAREALRRDDLLDVVTVVDRSGTAIGTMRRREPLRQAPELPHDLFEPRLRGTRGPSAVDTDPEPLPELLPLGSEPVATPRRPFGTRVQLSERARVLLVDPERPADVVRAVLTAAGHRPERHGEVVITDEVAIAIAEGRDDVDAALNRAFVAVRDSGCPRGLVIRVGYADPRLLHRRELATPSIRFVGSEAIQRMADAEALGADPLDFAVGPPVVT